MSEKKQTGSKLVSLNDELMSEFRISELEKRLETDPLVVANPIDGVGEDGTDCLICTDKYIYCSGQYSE